MQGLCVAMPTEIDPSLLKIVQSRLARVRRHYYVWFYIWLVLGLGAIVLPLLAALAPISDEQISRILAGAGAIAAASFGFLRPHVNAQQYHDDLRRTRDIETAVQLGVLTPPQIWDRFQKPPGRAIGDDYSGLAEKKVDPRGQDGVITSQ
jgi:hypothetical protein